MVDKVTTSITRMLSDICYQVEENSHRDKQFIKEEIRTKKTEVKGLYADCASTQSFQGTITLNSGVILAVCSVAGFVALPEGLKDIATSIVSRVAEGSVNYLGGRATSQQGNAQIGQKEMDLFQSRLQDVGTLDHKAQEILREAQDSERRIITG
jgi:hypothetical protein